MKALDSTKKTALTSCRIFSSLPASGIDCVAEHTDSRTYKAGDTLFSAGDESSSMYLVISGELSVVKKQEFAEDIEIARLVSGDSMGEIDMITGKPRTVTVRAETDAEILGFPAGNITFREYLESDPGTGAQILHAFIRDIADRTRRANAALKENSPHVQELRKQIYEDKLTGLFNKTWLEENLTSFLGTGKKICLLMFKPDNFKQINDHAGHEAGDSLLVHLAAVIPPTLPPNATLVRYSGNEFGIVLEGASRDDGTSLAEKIREFYNGLDVSRFLPMAGFHLTVSVGIAVYPEHGTAAETIIAAAHRLPLEGRGRGGNVILFPEDAPEVQQ
jgi:diguanylate cyclase (GGDEF)-like protein